jgi:hypothetical protein
MTVGVSRATEKKVSLKLVTDYYPDTVAFTEKITLIGCFSLSLKKRKTWPRTISVQTTRAARNSIPYTLDKACHSTDYLCLVGHVRRPVFDDFGLDLFWVLG